MLLLLQWQVVSVINLNMEMKTITWNIVFNVINTEKEGGEQILTVTVTSFRL